MPAMPFSMTSSAAACRIRSRVARPFAVAGACAFAFVMHLMVTELDLTVHSSFDKFGPFSPIRLSPIRRKSNEYDDAERKAERPGDPSAGVRCTDGQAGDGTRRSRSVSGAVLRDRDRARLGRSVEPARSGAEVPEPGGGVGARRHRTQRGAQDAPARRPEPRLDRG